MFLRRGLLCFCLLLCTAAVLNAQYDRGNILGTVHDGTGAVVTGVSITLKSLGTGTSSTTVSNSDGDYEFSSVPAGDYVVTARRTGFKDTSTPTFTITVGANQRVDLTLSAGNVTEQVIVSAGAALLETDSSD